MKEIVLFFRSNLKRNTTSLILAIACSVLLCLVFYNFGSSFAEYDSKGMIVGMIDEDNGAISNDFKRYLQDELNIVVKEGMSYDTLSNQLLEKKISAIIEIPSGFEKNGIVDKKLSDVITTTLDDYENAAFLKSYIHLYFSSVNLLVTAADGDVEQFQTMFKEFPNHSKGFEQTSVYVADREKDAARMGLSQAAGFFTMMMMALSLCIAFVVLEDRQSGVFGRIQISPVKPAYYIIGTSLYAICTSLLIVISFCSYLWINQYPIGIPISYLFIAMSLFSLFMNGLALIVALFLQTRNSVMTLIIIVGSTGPILGGSYFPVTMSPEFLQRISKMTPHYWMMQGIKDLMENPKADVRINLIILALFAILSFLVTTVKFVQKQGSKV